jgi:translation initiation factor 1
MKMPEAANEGFKVESMSTPRNSRPTTPAPVRVRVGREVAGRGGKGVSVISGLPLATTDLEALASRLKRLCGAGGAVRDGVIEIQGEHRDRLVVELGRLGYDAKRSGG